MGAIHKDEYDSKRAWVEKVLSQSYRVDILEGAAAGKQTMLKKDRARALCDDDAPPLAAAAGTAPLATSARTEQLCPLPAARQEQEFPPAKSTFLPPGLVEALRASEDL